MCQQRRDPLFFVRKSHGQAEISRAGNREDKGAVFLHHVVEEASKWEDGFGGTFQGANRRSLGGSAEGRQGEGIILGK